MVLPVEDYAVIGDTQTAALVGKDGSIDWLCVPRFDSAAIFAGLLGTEQHGRWLLAPAGDVQAVRRSYRGETLVLQTEFDTVEGTVRVIDFMPPRGGTPDVVRIVEGVHGTVPMRMQLRLRFDYGQVVPWVYREQGRPRRGRRAGRGMAADAGRDPRGENLSTYAEFSVGPGDRVPFVLTWRQSHQPPPAPTRRRSLNSGPPKGSGKAGCRRAPTRGSGASRWSAR